MRTVRTAAEVIAHIETLKQDYHARQGRCRTEIEERIGGLLDELEAIQAAERARDMDLLLDGTRRKE